MAQRYRVQFSDSDSFAMVIEQITTDNTSAAPKMISPTFAQGKALYWRVATMDEGGNLGGWASAALSAPKKLRMKATGRLHRGRRGTVRVLVTNTKSRAVAHVRVSLSGAGVLARPRTTNRRGTATFRIRPGSKGTLKVKAEARGFLPAGAKLRVR